MSYRQFPLPPHVADRPADAAVTGETFVVFIPRAKTRPTEPYDLAQLFLEFAWSARCRDGWPGAVRVLARPLRGLKGAGLIECRTLRRSGHPAHYGFVLTPLGSEAVKGLSRDWIEEAK